MPSLAVVIAIAALVISNTDRNPAPSAVQLGANLLDDFSGATINPATWVYSGTFTTTLDSPAIAIKNGRVMYDIVNEADEYLRWRAALRIAPAVQTDRRARVVGRCDGQWQ